MNSQMDAQMDLLCFNLMDFDMKNPIFPFNAAAFILEMSSIATSTDQIPIFDDQYSKRLGTPSHFQNVAFCSDFMRVMNQRLLTTDVKQAVVNFLQISFIPDPTIDLLCSEAFQASPQKTTKALPSTKRSPPKFSNQPQGKSSKNCNEPIR